MKEKRELIRAKQDFHDSPVRGKETISLLGDCVHHMGLFCFYVSHEVCGLSSSWYCTSPAQHFPCTMLRAVCEER